MDMTRLSALPYFMERFQESVARCPRLPMLVDARHPEGLTRRDVDEQSARVYAYLKRRGVGREDMVMICLPRGAETVVAMVGVWKAGAALTVAEDDLPPERIIQDATACCAQGIEFVLTVNYSYPEDYPQVEDEICVVGVFDTYQEGSYTYCTLRDAKLV